jgi:hypothetical protein
MPRESGYLLRKVSHALEKGVIPVELGSLKWHVRVSTYYEIALVSRCTSIVHLFGHLLCVGGALRGQSFGFQVIWST